MERKRTALVVLNPAAGRGAGRRLRAEVERALTGRGVDFELRETRAPGHGTEIAASAAGRADVVVAVGGDGTVHEVVNGLMRIVRERRPALGLIPIGTGNDLVKVVAGTRTRRDAYATLEHGTTIPMDVGHASWADGEEYFINAMGTGIDVEVVRQISQIRNLPGAGVYVLGLLRALMRFRPPELQVEMDGVRINRRFMMAAVTNGRSVGGAFQLSPGAAPDDGLLDVCLVYELNRLASALLAQRILRGRHGGHAAVEQRAAVRVTFETEGEPLFFQLDGELREPAGASRVAVEVRPAALSVIAAVAGNASVRGRVRNTMEVT